MYRSFFLMIVWIKNTIDWICYRNSKAKYLSNNRISVDFKDGSLKYTFTFRKTRQQNLVLFVLQGDGKDVSEEVKRAMGPGHDFYGIPTTPELLGFEQLEFIFLDGRSLQFGKTDTIVFNR